MQNTGFIPKVSRKSLLFIAAFVWLLAGSALLLRGLLGILNEQSPSLIKSVISIILGLTFYLFVFNRVSQKHIQRIKQMATDSVPFYAFFNRKSYIMMILMMSMGISLKIIGLIPLSLMVYFFPIMGLPLFISSIRFFKNAAKL